MADILEFKPKGSRAAGEPSPGPGQIVIFPGIRYERLEAEGEDGTQGHPRGAMSLPNLRQG